MVDEALKTMSCRFDKIYPEDGRKSIPPERLLRALLLQMLYSVRSERMLMEQMEYNLLFRWFVGLSANEPVWHPTVFTKNRGRLLEGAVAQELFALIVEQARRKKLLSSEHFTVDGTLIKAWAEQKSFVLHTKNESGDNDVGVRGRSFRDIVAVVENSWRIRQIVRPKNCYSKFRGQVAGQVHRPKIIKRQMYGRTGFAHRVLHGFCRRSTGTLRIIRITKEPKPG